MHVEIRQERDGDFPHIFDLTEAAFARAEESDHREQFLVERLHRSATFIPQLSLVAETDDGEIVGYVLLTEVRIVSENGTATSLAVAPLAVRPGFQRRGIGAALLGKAHETAAALGYGTAVLLGHEKYYPRFGYRRAIDYGVEFPFDVPPELCMIRELRPGAADGLSGTVHYPAPFFEQ